MNRTLTLTLCSLVLAAPLLRAQVSVFQLDPGTGVPTPSVDFMSAPYTGTSQGIAERVDTIQLGGTERVLAQVDVSGVGASFFGNASADVRVRFYSDAGTFQNVLWDSGIQTVVLSTTPGPITFYPSSTVVLPSTPFYYGIEMSNFGPLGTVILAGPMLTDASSPTPTSANAPQPVIPQDTYWYRNSGGTYTQAATSNNRAMAITVLAIPEPGTFGLALVGVLLLRRVILRRR